MTWNASTIGGLVSAFGKFVSTAGIIWPPAIAIGLGISGVGSIISGTGADKTADVLDKPQP